MQYFGYLRRNPDDAPDSDMSGYNFWLSKLNGHNGDFAAAEMVKSFLVSPNIAPASANPETQGAARKLPAAAPAAPTTRGRPNSQSSGALSGSSTVPAATPRAGRGGIHPIAPCRTRQPDH
jgi:hypothetical protein